MSENNIFSTPTGDVTPPVVSPVTPTLPPEVVEFIGTGKKYNSVEDALKSVPHAQKHIQSIEQENATLKAELEKRKTTEQLLEEIRNSNVQQSSTNVPVGLDSTAIANLIEQTIQQKEVQRSAQENTTVVINSFKAKYGEKAEESYINLAKETGLTVQYLNNLAATSPTALLKLAGMTNNTNTTVGKPSSTINTEAFTSNQTPQVESARVKQGASTKELVRAWKAAGVKVGKTT